MQLLLLRECRLCITYNLLPLLVIIFKCFYFDELAYGRSQNKLPCDRPFCPQRSLYQIKERYCSSRLNRKSDWGVYPTILFLALLQLESSIQLNQQLYFVALLEHKVLVNSMSLNEDYSPFNVAWVVLVIPLLFETVVVFLELNFFDLIQFPIQPVEQAFWQHSYV